MTTDTTTNDRLGALLADLSGLDTPAPIPGSNASPRYLTDPHGLYARARDPQFGAWMAHAARARGCTRPIRLAGTVTTLDPATGAVLDRFHTDDLPDRTLYKPCGTRRASVCPACAETYRWDTYHLIAAGLRGGKGVPHTVTAHPAVFPTLTAPSFGIVHTRPTDRTGRPKPCRPRRERPTCPHGRALSCPVVHRDDDRRLGQPLCLDCYDHTHHVVWNHYVPKLWDRTMTRLRRLLALHLGRAIADHVKLRYVKVGEYQRRGVIHLHAVVRLDGYNRDQPDDILPPPAYRTPTGELVPVLDATTLAQLVNQAAADTALQTPPHPDQPAGWQLAWGTQTHTEVINHGIAADHTLTADDVTDHLDRLDRRTDIRRIAGYLAKYATKDTEATGTVAPRLTPNTVAVWADPDTHTGRLIDACWHLGRPHGTDDDHQRPYAGLRRWAHTLGFGGHFSTKSRRYSTTLGTLRAARRPGNHPTATDPNTTAIADHADRDQAETTLIINTLAYIGSGWKTSGDAALALQAADAARARQPANLPRT
jgi:hypothetical protein